VDWDALFGTRRRVDLPTYAFQRQRYWLSSSHTTVEASSTELPPAADDHIVSLADRIAALTDDDAKAFVLDHVLEKVAVVLGHSSGDSVDPDQEFKELGFDSLLSVELSKRLTASTGLKLRANTVLRHPSPRLVAEHVATSMSNRGPR
jgi:acyl transferase domain-containing protein